MDNNDNYIDFSRLSIDPTIQPLACRKDTGYANHLRACQCLSHWTKGYFTEQIALFFKISVADVEMDLAHIENLYTRASFEVKLREREEILRARKQGEEAQRRLSEKLSRPAESYLKARRNPANALAKFRKGIGAEDPSPISALRQKNSGMDLVDEKAAEHDLEEERQRILALRKKEAQPAKKVLPADQVRGGYNPTLLDQYKRTQEESRRKPGGERTDLRITFRLDPGLYEALRKHAQDMGIEMSALIRKAITQYLDSDAESKVTTKLGMPQEALSLTGRYQVAGSDLKEKLRESFLQLLAQAYVTTGRWPRAEWVRELYLGLLPLHYCLERDDVRHQ